MFHYYCLEKFAKRQKIWQQNFNCYISIVQENSQTTKNISVTAKKTNDKKNTDKITKLY